VLAREESRKDCESLEGWVRGEMLRRLRCDGWNESFVTGAGLRWTWVMMQPKRSCERWNDCIEAQSLGGCSSWRLRTYCQGILGIVEWKEQGRRGFDAVEGNFLTTVPFRCIKEQKRLKGVRTLLKRLEEGRDEVNQMRRDGIAGISCLIPLGFEGGVKDLRLNWRCLRRVRHEIDR